MLQLNKIKLQREKHGLTQTELAERAGLSLRTIQRLEAGNTPKGYTLRSLATVLEVPETTLLDTSPIQDNNTVSDHTNIRLMNTVAFSFLFLPYANIILPVLIWRKNRKSAVVFNEGIKIINFQIFWTITTSLLLLICPYIQSLFLIKFSLILWVLAVAFTINILFLLRTSIILNRNKCIPNLSPIRFL